MVLLDSDGLIASVKPDDVFHAKAQKIIAFLTEKDIPLGIATSTIAEVITTIDRRFHRRDLASKLYLKLVSGWAQIFAVDEQIVKKANTLFANSKSKKNTIFDSINVVVSQKYNIETLFSFDKWYRKQKLVLIDDLIHKDFSSN